jgi:hypothetical protein
MTKIDPVYEASREIVDSPAEEGAAYSVMIKITMLARIHYYR